MQMQAMLRKMSVQQVDIDAVAVIIRKPDKECVFDNPQVSKVNMMGQETYQIVGRPRVVEIDTTPEISEDDIKTIMEQTDVSEDKAREVLLQTKGDIAEAILELSSE